MGKFEQPRKKTQKTPAAKPSAAQKKAAAGGSPAKKKSGNGKVAALVAAAVVCLAVFGVAIYAYVLHSSGDIFPNVYVAGVNIGGMSREEATEAVQAAVDQTYGTSTLTVQLPDRTLSFAPAETQVSLDVEQAVEEAWNYGRQDGVFQTLVATISGSTGEHFVNIQDSLSINEEYVRSVIDGAAADVQSERMDSTYDVVETEVAATEDTPAETVPTQLVIHVGTSQRSLDADALYDAVIAAFMNNDFSVIQFDYDEEAYQPVDLSAIYDEMCTDMADAYYDSENKVIVEEVVGYGFDLAAAEQQQAMAEEGSTLTITLAMVEPEVTLAELEATLFADELADVDSPHTWNPGRTTNLELACQAIDGTILNPGDVFSFNDTVGERTAAKGYQAATVFVSGTSTPELGGGVCQVASAIYYAALLADLNIVERTEHMFTVSYVPMGMDATIYWGSNLDFKFSNSTEYPLRIDASVSDGYVHITLVGTKTTDTTVELDHVVNAVYNWEDVVEEDESLPADYEEVTVSPYTGYRTTTIKRYLDANGNPISEWENVQFPNSYYQKRDRVTTIGKQPDPEDPTTTDPTDPGTTDPGTTDPGTTDPGTTDPGTTDPGTTDPGTTDPGTTDPGTTDPGTTDPGTTDPGTTDPGTIISGETDPETDESSAGTENLQT